jgi:hypothetical protein
LPQASQFIARGRALRLITTATIPLIEIYISYGMASRLAHGLSRENLRVDALSAPPYGRASSDAVRPAMLGRGSGSTPDAVDAHPGSKRLGFFGERDKSSSGAILFLLHSHSRADSAMSPAGSAAVRDVAASPAPGQVPRPHASPSSSKVRVKPDGSCTPAAQHFPAQTTASARTYDSKVSTVEHCLQGSFS